LVVIENVVENMTKVVNIKHSRYDIYCGRAGKGQDGYFGNPFRVGIDGTRDECIIKYRNYFGRRMLMDNQFAKRIHELKDKTLGCFCKPKPCHVDVIAEYLDADH
jgi:hypothetical protein